MIMLRVNISHLCLLMVQFLMIERRRNSIHIEENFRLSRNSSVPRIWDTRKTCTGRLSVYTSATQLFLLKAVLEKPARHLPRQRRGFVRPPTATQLKSQDGWKVGHWDSRKTYDLCFLLSQKIPLHGFSTQPWQPRTKFAVVSQVFSCGRENRTSLKDLSQELGDTVPFYRHSRRW